MKQVKVIPNLEMTRHGSYSQLSDWQAQYVVLYFLEKIQSLVWCEILLQFSNYFC